MNGWKVFEAGKGLKFSPDWSGYATRAERRSHLNGKRAARFKVPTLVSLLKKNSYVVLCIVIFTACENDVNEVERVTRFENPLQEVANDIEILYSEDGEVKAKLLAPQMTKNSEAKPYTEFNNGLNVYILDKNKNTIAELSANYGIKYDKDDTTVISKNVRVVNQDGDILETEKLTRNDKTGELHTDAFVKITKKYKVIKGMGLTANEDFSSYKIDSVQGEVRIFDSPIPLN